MREGLTLFPHTLSHLSHPSMCYNGEGGRMIEEEKMEDHTNGPMELSETPDGILILDTRVSNCVHIREEYLNRVPTIAHRLLYNNFQSQMERLYLDGFKHLSMEVRHFNDS